MQTAVLPLTLNVEDTLTVTTTTLPDAIKDSPYSFLLLASGGVPSYQWSVSSGSLPAGLTLSDAGLISGTPSGSGSFNFTVQVQDSSL